jgi:formylglycine-generating enzyme required for sulfatase activity
VVFLVAGVLYQQGISKVDALFSAILNDLQRRSPISSWAKRFRTNEKQLAAQARAVGLLGGILQDLGPLRYRSADPRLEANLRTILGIFEAEQIRNLEFKLRLEAAEALGQAGDPQLNGDNWVWIDAGHFTFGESPRQEIDLSGYGIGRYPVTVEEYRRFVEDGGYDNQRWWRNGFPSRKHAPDKWDEQIQHANRPVVGVSWYEVMAYCEWQGVQLPIEAEWERAARGKEGRRYPWGDAEPDTAFSNYCESVIGHPTPVGLYPLGSTPDGVLDLAGNVWEWTTDWFVNGKTRTVRGGAWNTNKWLLRSMSRFGLDPSDRRANVGFRVRQST